MILDISTVLALFASLALFAQPVLLLLDEKSTDGSQEVVQTEVEVVLVDTEVKVQQSQELALHQVDLGVGEAEVGVALDGSVACPVLVLGGRIVEVLGRENQRREEDAVSGALHALGGGGKTLLETTEVDQSRHEGGNLDMRHGDQGDDELFQRGQVRIKDDGRGALRGSARRSQGEIVMLLADARVGGCAVDDLASLLGQVVDHLLADRQTDEVVHGLAVVVGGGGGRSHGG